MSTTNIATGPGPVGSWEIKVDTGELYWSDEIYRIHGMEVGGEIDLDAAIRIYHPDDREKVAEYVRRALEYKEDYQFDLRIVHADGSTRDVRSTGIVRLNKAGEVETLTGAFQDITVALAGERALSRNAELLEQAEHLAGMGHWIFYADTQEIYWSDGIYRIHGMEPGAEVDLEVLLGNFHPDDRKIVEERIQRALEYKEEYEYELRIIRQDGELRHVKSTGRVKLKANGDVDQLFGILRDITAEKEADEALRQSEKIFRDFVDHSPSAILIKGVDGRYQQANRRWREIFNKDGREIIGRTTAEFYPDDVAEEVEKKDRQVIETEKSAEYHFVDEAEDGSIVENFIHKFPIFNEQGVITHIASIDTDISELKRARDTAERSQTRLFEALENISDSYAYYDSDQRLVYCNNRLRELYPLNKDVFKPGVHLRDVIRAGAERGQYAAGVKDIDAWVETQLGLYENARQGYTQELADGGILFCSDSRSSDGGYVCTRTDITGLVRAEKELAVSESRFRRLFDTAEISIWDEDFSEIAVEFDRLRGQGVTDLAEHLKRDHREVFRLAGLVKINSVNEATPKMYGIESAREFIANLGEIITEESANVFIGVLTAIWNKDDYFVTEAKHQTFDGREIAVMVSLPIPKQISEWHNVPVCVLDITERTRAEEELLKHKEMLELMVADRTRELQSSEGKLQDLMDGSQQGILVHKDFKILFTNDTFAEILGYTAEEIMNLSSSLDFIAPEDREKLAGFHRQRVEGNEAPERFEYRAQRKDGSLIWFSSRVREVNWEGELAIQNSVVDITERKNAVDALAERERLFRNILETSPIGMGIANVESGAANFVNDAHLELLGRSREEFLQMSGRDHWYDQNERGKFVETFEENGFATGEVQLRRNDGTPFWTVQRWVQSPGSPDDMLYWSYDISALKDAREEMKAARDEAEKSSLAKSEFLSSMSHELRTPLNSILGFGQILDDDTYSPLSPDQKDSLDHILRGGHHLLDLINEVLDLTRIETGQIQIDFEEIVVGDIIAECRALTESLAAENNLKISVEEHGLGSTIVTADLTRFRQVLLNLLSNAVKYNRQGGGIILSCASMPNNRLRITVTDTGQGIAPENFQRVFEPFERLGAEGSAIEGTGIGLAISKTLVEEMGGAIGFRSEIGIGSSFWFDINVSDDQAFDSDLSNKSQAGSDIALKGRHTILYVEDNPANLLLMEKIVHSVPNLSLISSENAELGLALAVSTKPSLILMDINLPGMDGFDALRRLGEHRETKNIPVVAVSAKAFPEDVKKGLNAGFKAYVRKPIVVDSVLEVIKNNITEVR
jgi:PAS domain S-box-containing protein